MKTYTWSAGEISEGLTLQTDDKLGMVVFLGEDGRGRRYEKVGLSRRNSPEVIKGKVLEAEAQKITLPAKEGKPEKVFYVLERPRSADNRFLVRVCTRWVYTKSTNGSWRTIAGTPETLVEGYGAHGDAGRICQWADGLVVMKSGDTLRVHPEGGYKVEEYALWISSEGKLQTATLADWERITAMAKAEAVIAEAKAVPEALPAVFGQAKCLTLTWGGELSGGIKVGTSLAGPAVVLGDTGRGREQVSIPLVGFTTDKVEEAAMVRLSKNVLGLTQTSTQPEPQGALVRFYYPERHRALTEVKSFRGNPELLAKGRFASGGAGYAGHTPDELWALRPGDICSVGWDSPVLVAENVSGEIRVTNFCEWELADADQNPEAYVAQGKVRPNRIPANWIGRVVTVIQRRRTYDSRVRKYVGTHFEEVLTGELVLASPLRVNTGWDGRDRKIEQPYASGNGDTLEVVWVRLEIDKVVQNPEPVQVATRTELKLVAEKLLRELNTVHSAPYFKVLPKELKARLEEVSGVFSPPLEERKDEDIQSWISTAQALLQELQSAEPAAKALQEKIDSGEILVDFSWGVRTGTIYWGAAWVVAADGQLVPPTKVAAYRGMEHPFNKEDPYEYGEHHWEGVLGPENLVLVCGGPGVGGGDLLADSSYTVVKKSVGGLTEAQGKTVAWVEYFLATDFGRLNPHADDASEEDKARFGRRYSFLKGIFGFDPEVNLWKRALADSLRKRVAACPASRQPLDWSDPGLFQKLTGGFGLSMPAPSRAIEAWIPRGINPLNQDFGRKAVHSVPVFGGFVDCFVDLYGPGKFQGRGLRLRLLYRPQE